MTDALLLVAHGTVDDLDELPEFVARIRRGHAAPPELLAELRRRYEAIGGSPLNAINRRLAARVEKATGVMTRVANRLARPLLNDVIAGLVADGVTRVAAVPLAQYSAAVYAEATEAAAKEAGIEAVCATSWAQEPALIDAYADAIRASLGELAAASPAARPTVVLSAHSLPTAVIRAGDAYEREVRATADAVVARLGLPSLQTEVAFQSQGMSKGPGGRPVEWLGPDLVATLDACRARGDGAVVFAPIGFLADHVEILYDLDVEARRWVEDRGMLFRRTPSLNDGDAIVGVIARVAGSLLREPRSRDHA